MADLEVQKRCDAGCTETFDELLCVTFTVTFTVDIVDCEITNVECLGPCPPPVNGCDDDCCEPE